MRSMKILGLCFIASLALSAVVSASAMAKNPRWGVCLNRVSGGQWEDGQCSKAKTNGSHETRELKTNETIEITAEANGIQKLHSATVTIECKKLKLKSGAEIIGGEPGTDAETIVYEECGIEGFPKCKVRNVGGTFKTIETKPLNSTLGYKTKEQEEKENQEDTVTVFKPKTANTFVEIEMEAEPGGTCPSTALEKKGLPVTGEVACENVSATKHAVEHELKCPAEESSEVLKNTGYKQPNKNQLP